MNSLLLPALATVAITLLGCGDQASDSSSQTPVQTPVPPAFHPASNADLARFDNLIKQYENIQTRVGQAKLTALDNPLEVILFRLKDMRKALGGFAFIMPTDALVEVIPSALEAAAMPPTQNVTYWKTLENSMLGVGYVESGRSSGIYLMAKEFPDQLPKDACLVM